MAFGKWLSATRPSTDRLGGVAAGMGSALATLEHRVSTLRGSFTDDDRAFLQSFEAGDPDWDRFPIAALAELPAPQFKLMNIRKFREVSRSAIRRFSTR